MGYLDELERQVSDNYTGLEDNDYIGFDGEDFDSDWIGAAPTVAGSKNVIDQFKFSITNTTGMAAVIALFPGFLPTARPVFATGAAGAMKAFTANGAEVTVPDDFTPRMCYDALENVKKRNSQIVAVLDEGILADGKIYIDPLNPAKYIKIVPQRGSIREFVQWFKRYPTMVKNIVMEVNDVSVFGATSIMVTRIDPFNDKGSFNISPSDFLDTKQNQDKKVVINTLAGYGRAFQIDRESIVTMQLADTVNGSANTITTLQFNLNSPYSIDRNAFESKTAPVVVKKSVVKKVTKPKKK